MRIRMSILMLVALFSLAGSALAEDMKAEKETVTEVKEEVGNKICPTEGAKIGSMGEGIQVEHEGKIYNLCCADCIKIFKEDPEKYHKIADKEVGSEIEEGEDHEGHDHGEHDKKDTEESDHSEHENHDHK